MTTPDDRVVVRDATLADVPRLADLRIAFDLELTDHVQPDREAEHRGHIETYLASHLPTGRFRAWVAEAAGGELVAMAGRVVVDRPPYSRFRPAPEVFVFNVYTQPAWRGRGIARRLMEAIVGEAREIGARRVILRTSDAGRPVYEGLGFRDPGNWLQLDLA